MHSHIDFGYGWQWTSGHLVITAIFLPLFILAWKRKWSRWRQGLLLAVTLWSLAAFVIVRFVLDFNGRTELPTQSFLRSGTGRVLDMGAGSGRSSLMVLEARPQATLVALDLFGESYAEHFNVSGTDVGTAKLRANLQAAGVENRASIQPGDMRQMPFEPATFDAIVSAYAIDHLNRTGMEKALREANRVLKPGGEFLMMVIAKDAWLDFAWGPVIMHGGTPRPERWVRALNATGFDVVEQGKRPATLFFFAHKR
ncbi:MAG: methyltransferase domain-containing protein [Acidobacteriia bacterium]|nr:methyltransferase domain-containing protein [Terriglobia bacterium]